MFDNIGGKIKGFAEAVCWIGIIASIILAIVSFISSIELDGVAKTLAVIGGFLYLILGPLLSWLSTITLYGFGELIENSQTIAYNTQHSRYWSLSRNSQNVSHKKICSECGAPIAKYPCEFCGHKGIEEANQGSSSQE